MQGKVKRYPSSPSPNGSIVGEDGRNYGFHLNDRVAGQRYFTPGALVSFTPDGNAARQVSLISSTHSQQNRNHENHHRVNRPNSFPKFSSDAISGQAKTPPYDFVPVDIGKAVSDTPVFHDGMNADQAELISGEFRCSLTALTPLLVGHDSYEAKHVNRPKNKFVTLPQEWDVNFSVAEDKHILEPLMLDDRVLIPGSSLNGMLRHSLGALLNAPMERVAERSYSYRPNLNHVNRDAKYECRPAVVESNNGSEITVMVLPKSRSAIFLRDEYSREGKKYNGAYDKIASQNKGLKPGDKVNKKCAINFETYTNRAGKTITNRNRIVAVSDKSLSLDLDHICFSYAGGIDGTGTLAGLFNSRAHTYKHVLVSASDWGKALPLPISGEILSHYLRTQKHLRDDQDGHISSRHPFKQDDLKHVARDIKQHSFLQPNQLIYVEVELNGDGVPLAVTSLGHNYQYRWRYTDTVRNRWSGMVDKEQTRPILSPLDDELESDQDGKPNKLSGARLFFGYASSDKEDSGTKDIGRDDFTRLAGRVSCNIAVEQTNDSTDISRFVDHAKAVPLKTLGMPRSSAVENYLQQPDPESKLQVTYGDLPDEEGAELRGRKFYPHQPGASLESNYFKAQDEETIKSNKAVLARHMLKPNAEFRFTLRFRYLRSWELGALMLALEPWRICDFENLPANVSDLQNKAAREKADHSNNPLFAHKLGYGRPLGLGSVQVMVKEIHCWSHENGFPSLKKASLSGSTNPNDDMPIQWLRAFDDEKLKESLKYSDSKVLKQWLEVHQYRGQPRCDYSLGNDGKIFTWHTNKRRAHAKARRTRR